MSADLLAPGTRRGVVAAEAAARQRRAKRALLVAAGILAVLLVIEVPKLMSLSAGSAAGPGAATSSTVTSRDPRTAIPAAPQEPIGATPARVGHSATTAALSELNLRDPFSLPAAGRGDRLLAATGSTAESSAQPAGATARDPFVPLRNRPAASPAPESPAGATGAAAEAVP